MIEGLAPVRRTVVDTSDPELGSQLLSRIFVSHDARISGSAEQFRMRIAGLDAGDLRLDEISYSMNSSSFCDPYHRLVVVQIERGGLTMATKRTTVSVAAGQWAVCDTLCPQESASENLQARLVSFDLGAVRDLAVAEVGAGFGRMGFDQTVPIDRKRAQRWAETFDRVGDDLLCSDHLVNNSIIRKSAFRTLIRTALVTFPNPALGRLVDPTAPGAGGPGIVRRAVDHIESHAAEPIGVEDVALAAGSRVPELREAFRRHRSTTPLQYLRRVRLERAHQDLRAGDPHRGDTVARTAIRWGFVHLDRFAAGYRRVYGRSPEDTLRA